MTEKKPIPESNVSLNYMSWAVKDLVIELKKANENLEKLAKVIAEKKEPF